MEEYYPPYDKWFEIRIFPSPEGLSIFFSDITERKKAEHDLVESQAALRAVNQELNLFIYKSSHDLQGPLASISGLTEIAQLETADDKALFYFKLINDSTKKLNSTLSHLIEMLHVKDKIVNVSEISIDKVLKEVLKGLELEVQTEKLRFIFDLKNITITTDESLLIAILYNIIQNAIKFQKENATEGWVKIKSDKDNDFYKITVEDNGIGIDSTQHEKIFDMFARGNILSRGSGLGLYVSKMAVERLHGKIAVESKLNEGAKFCIFLPLTTKSIA